MTHRVVAPRETPSILNVAALSGVSPATVSRALRDLPGVSASTRRLVQEAAAQLQYQPSPFAAALASGRTRAIGLILPTDVQWLSMAMLDGVQQVLHPQGFDLMLYPSIGPGRPGNGDNPNYRRVDGLLMPASGLSGHQATPARPTVPVVSIGLGTATMPGISTNNIEAGRLATQHLIDLGHRHIAFIGTGSPAVNAAADRFRGYQMVMRSAGARPTRLLVPHAARTDHVLRQLLSPQAPGQKRATAVITSSDDTAIAMLHAARRLGVRVPGDLSIASTDGGEPGCLLELTTAGAPPVELGRLAAALLLALIAGDPPPESPITVNPVLCTRRTTGPIPATTGAAQPALLPRRLPAHMARLRDDHSRRKKVGS